MKFLFRKNERLLIVSMHGLSACYSLGLMIMNDDQSIISDFSQNLAISLKLLFIKTLFNSILKFC